MLGKGGSFDRHRDKSQLLLLAEQMIRDGFPRKMVQNLIHLSDEDMARIEAVKPSWFDFFRRRRGKHFVIG